MKTVYVVSIPWDSHMVNNTYVFEDKEDAQKYADRRNETGYNGFVGGLVVEEREIIKKGSTQ